MRLLVFCSLLGLGLFLGGHLRAQSSATQTSASLTAQGVQLLQEGKRDEALKALERAFELANDPEEIRRVGALILEASPSDYPKRENYLRYLVRFAGEHEDARRWLKELGDRAFDAGRFDHAEDWYLRAMPHLEDTSLVRYRLAWVYWNQRGRVRAYDLFLDLYSEAGSELRSQIRQDVSRLWWEIGRIPAPSFSKFIKMDEADRALFLNEVLAASPRTSARSADIEKVFLQLKETSESHLLLRSFLKEGFSVTDRPCFLFEKILDPQDEYPKEQLLRCASVDKGLAVNLLLRFFDHVPESQRDETIDWAHADLLFQDKKTELGIQMLLDSGPLDRRSSEYLDFLESRLMALTDGELKVLEAQMSRASLQAFVQARPGTAFLARLQTVNPEFWFSYEEKLVGTKAAPKEFWVRKAIWLAGQEAVDERQLLATIDEIGKHDLKPSESAVRTQIDELRRRSETKLPREFGEEFQKEYESWIADLDRAIQILAGTSEEWKAFSLPIFRQRLSQNVYELVDQIAQLRLPEGEEGASSQFERQKRRLRTDLERKYRAYLVGRDEMTAGAGGR